MRKILLFLTVIIIIFGAIGFLTAYQNKEKTADNPYQKDDLHSETIAQLDDSNYQNIILPDELESNLDEGKAETVYFYSPTCSYCKQTTPIVVPLAEEMGVDLKMYNVLEFEQGWDDYKIEGTPTIIHFEDGEEVARISGSNEEEVFQEWFDEYVVK